MRTMCFGLFVKKGCATFLVLRFGECLRASFCGSNCQHPSIQCRRLKNAVKREYVCVRESEREREREWDRERESGLTEDPAIKFNWETVLCAKLILTFPENLTQLGEKRTNRDGLCSFEMPWPQNLDLWSCLTLHRDIRSRCKYPMAQWSVRMQLDCEVGGFDRRSQIKISCSSDPEDCRTGWTKMYISAQGAMV